MLCSHQYATVLGRVMVLDW